MTYQHTGNELKTIEDEILTHLAAHGDTTALQLERIVAAPLALVEEILIALHRERRIDRVGLSYRIRR